MKARIALRSRWRGFLPDLLVVMIAGVLILVRIPQGLYVVLCLLFAAAVWRVRLRRWMDAGNRSDRTGRWY